MISLQYPKATAQIMKMWSGDIIETRKIFLKLIYDFTYCSKTSLPLGLYNVHSGSIVDISTLKNQIDTKRLRADNQATTNGRLFVKFVALIQHSKIMSIIKKDEKLKKYSLCEIMFELKKLKLNCFDKNNTFL